MTADLVERLRDEWRGDLGCWGAPAEFVDAAFDQLVACHAAPHRHYHTLDHVAATLRVSDGLAADVGIPDARPIRLAAWYHDVVYDPRSTDNEDRSAVLAAADLISLLVPGDTVQECVRLIGLTAQHRVEHHDRNGAVLVDADLAILASSPDRYDRYAAGIRAEYGHLDDDTFARGRARVLAGFLGRRTIFNTPGFRTEREARARANLEREIGRIG